MIIAMFFLTCIAIMIFGLVFVGMTMRHHRRNELTRKQNAALLAKAGALADERLP